MKRLKIFLKIDFFFLRKTDVFLKFHLLDGFFNEFSYLSRCHKYIIMARFRRAKRGSGVALIKHCFPAPYYSVRVRSCFIV